MKTVFTTLLLLIFIGSIPLLAQQKTRRDYKHPYSQKKQRSKVPQLEKIVYAYQSIPLATYRYYRKDYKHGGKSLIDQKVILSTTTREAGFFSSRNYKHHKTQKFKPVLK